MSLSVVLADDHHVVRAGLRRLLESNGITVVGEAGNGHDAVKLVHDNNPSIVVLDHSMPQLNGLDAAREILHANPSAKIIILTVHVEEHYMIAALRAGIRGYVIKSQATTDLVVAIQLVAGGGTYLAPRVASVVATYLAGFEADLSPLTYREREVLQLVAEGKTTNEIAAVLCVNFKTVETYRARLRKKLDIHEIAGLVRYAVRAGMIEA